MRLLFAFLMVASVAHGQVWVQNYDVGLLDRTDGKIMIGDGSSFVLFGTTISNNGDADSFIVNSTDNVAEAGLARVVIAGGGLAGGPNRIGTTGAPTGSDFTPPAWAADSGYVAESANTSVISGGYDNVQNQLAGVIAGGGHNFMKYDAVAHSVIGGGSYNLIAAGRSVICGGRRNAVTGSIDFGSILGGDDNWVYGNYASILGGRSCEAASNYCLAFGRRAKANNLGSVALSDSTDADFDVSTNDQFGARYAGGYYLTGDYGVGINVAPVDGYPLTLRQTVDGQGLTLQGYDDQSSSEIVFRVSSGGTGQIVADGLMTFYANGGGSGNDVWINGSGYLSLPNDNQKLVLGAAQAADSSLAYTGSYLDVVATGGLKLDSYLAINGTPDSNVGVDVTTDVTGTGFYGFQVTNSSAAGQSYFRAVNDAGAAMSFGYTGSTRGASVGINSHGVLAGDDGLVFMSDGTSASGGTNTIDFRAGGYNADQERMRITDAGVLIGTTTEASANGSKMIVFGDNGADPTMDTDTCGIYGKDDTGVEVFVVDEADNATKISPHDNSTGEWIFYSRNTHTGRVVRVDMERLVRFLDEYHGTHFYQESQPLETKQ